MIAQIIGNNTSGMTILSTAASPLGNQTVIPIIVIIDRRKAAGPASQKRAEKKIFFMLMLKPQLA